MSKEPETQPLSLGATVLDRYRVIEHVAAGGHSVVYRGQDERLSRPVCIKVFSRLPAEHGVSRASYEHFVQEAFALSRLTHPNTLRIYDFGHITLERETKKGEVPFQVCEFMNGGTLANIVRDLGPQSATETLRIIGAMCDALAEAHALGIVHRDIKPQNILFAQVGGNRLPKLADFGIAKWNDAEEPSGDKKSRAGDTQVVAGAKMAMYSPSWAAPEQLSGQKVSPATDIYSLAVVAIYMLTANPIFACDDVYDGYKKRRHADELLADAFATFQYPHAVVETLSHALAFAPEDRMPRIGDLIGALTDSFEPATVEHAKLKAKDRAGGSTVSTVTHRLVPPGGAPPAPQAPLAAGSTIQPQRPASSSAPPPLPPPPPAGARGTPPPSLGEPVSPRGSTPAVGVAVTGPQLAPIPGGDASVGPPRRVQVSPSPIAIADRMAHFAPLANGAADVADVAAGVRVRVTLMPQVGGSRRTIHLKALSSFIAISGGRPTSAIQVTGDTAFDLISPGSQVLARGQLALGSPAAGHTVFRVGSEAVAVGLDECPEVVLIDFGAGRPCHFVYTPGPGLARPASRRDRPRTNNR
jgi:serine/threonine-protein kinase